MEVIKKGGTTKAMEAATRGQEDGSRESEMRSQEVSLEEENAMYFVDGMTVDIHQLIKIFWIDYSGEGDSTSLCKRESV